MAMIKRLLCFFVLHVQACFSQSSNNNRLPSLQTCTHESNYGFENDTNSRIVGGTNAKKNEWPFIVRLEVETRDYFALCSGTVVDNYWILRWQIINLFFVKKIKCWTLLSRGCGYKSYLQRFAYKFQWIWRVHEICSRLEDTTRIYLSLKTIN